MIISTKWLRDYVDFAFSAEDLAERLTMVGLEVEGLQKLSAPRKGFLTVRLDTVKAHPNADRLRICEVSDGGRTYRVVCGAPNLQEGSVVVLACPGAVLPDGNVMEEARIRGELSHGMLCSQKELALGEDASGIWTLPPETPIGLPLSEALNIDDVILEVSITPNRGDCLSTLGIAREVAAIAGSSVRYPTIALSEKGPDVESLTSVTIHDPVGCPRYAARVLQGVTIGPSPNWLKDRLEAVGVRSINNVVDVSNYILMEMGQPLHTFDFDRLRDHRIEVRRALDGERFTTLDGVERRLFEDSLLICDGRGPVAIAGIMGGLNSEIVPETQRVLIESAYFDPGCIRRTGKKIGLRSESSYRFERGVDPEGVIRALNRAAQLICELGGGEVARGVIDVYPRPIQAPTLNLRVDRTNRFLGSGLTASDMAKVLRSIEMQVEEKRDDLLQVVPPAFRPDIAREVDLTEEVARLVGFDRIPVTYPRTVAYAEPLDGHLKSRLEVKSLLQGAGFFEVINYSFISQESLDKLRFASGDVRLKPVRILNPLSEEQAVMRTSLVPGLLQTARYNFDHRNEDLRIFELSKIFLPREGEILPEEPHHLMGVIAGRRSPQLLYGGEDEADYTDAKGILEEVLALFHLEEVDLRAGHVPAYFDPLKAAEVRCRGLGIGAVGKLHPEVESAFDLKRSVYLFELDFDKVYNLQRPHPLFKPLPRFPSVARDMAIVVEESVQVREPLDFILAQQESLLQKVEIFDIYRSQALEKGKKSLGYRLEYRSSDRSLTDEEINDLHGRLVDKVLVEFHGVLR